MLQPKMWKLHMNHQASLSSSWLVTLMRVEGELHTSHGVIPISSTALTKERRLFPCYICVISFCGAASRCEEAAPCHVKWRLFVINQPKCYRSNAGLITHPAQRNDTVPHIHHTPPPVRDELPENRGSAHNTNTFTHICRDAHSLLGDLWF